MLRFHPRQDYETEEYDSYTPYTCRHGIEGECEECDDMDIDKCLNCGRYRASTSLDRFQVCKNGCRNPNEY